MTKQHKGCTDFYLKQPYQRGCECECHVGSAGDAGADSDSAVPGTGSVHREDAVRRPAKRRTKSVG